MMPTEAARAIVSPQVRARSGNMESQSRWPFAAFANEPPLAELGFRE
jgi:hypothetical protein